MALATGLLSVVAVPSSNATQVGALRGPCVARAGVGGILNISATGTVGRATGLAFGTRIYAKEITRTAAAGAADGTVTLQTGIIRSGYTETGTTGLVLPILGESITVGLATITYSVWTQSGTNYAGAGHDTDATDAPGVNSRSTTVTCTIAGAPTSFSLSSTSASVANGESATITITPKDANGVTTLLVESITAANPVVETFTVSASSDSTGVVTMVAGKGNLGAVSTLLAAGAGYRPLVNPATLRTLYAQQVWESSTTLGVTGVANTNGQEAQQNQDTQTIRIKYARDTGTVSNRNAARGLAVTGVLSTNGANNRLNLDSRFADTATSGAITNAVAGETLTVGLNNFSGETLTATGAFTVRVSVVETATSTTTFTIAGGAGTSGVTASTFTLTTQSFGYGTSYSFGSASAMAAAGNGIKLSAAGGLDAPGTSGTTSISGAGTASGGYELSTATGKTVRLKIHSGASAATIPVTIAARTGITLPTGITAGTTNYTTVGNGTETSTTVTLAATAPLNGQGYTVSWKSDANTTRTMTMTYETPKVGDAIGSVTLNPSGITGKQLAAGSNTVEVTVTDQFGDPVQGATALMTLTGRNATTAPVTQTTDVNGKTTYTWTDAGAAIGTTTVTSTDSAAISVQTSNATAALSASTVTITYVASLDVTTLTLTNGSATAGTAVDSGVTFTATALGAGGVALAGYPVVFTGDAKTYWSTVSNTITVYTGTNGVATATFKGKTIGAATVTATSGGKSATSSYTVLKGGSRVIAVDAATATMAPGESKRVTATVTDGYGNAVDAATVTVTYTGTAGRVASLNGVSAASGTTDTNGKVVVELSADIAGTGTLTLAITAGDASTSATMGNGAARPASVASVTTAVTISGVNASVTASNAATAAAEAAVDAAAEAIDAANAATDAANLAAEAADAATVAAEEARDAADAATAAVEELATQVATLMAALKAQITTLANTVAKIAKKVKA
jgi:hypothetical protein